MQTSSGKIQRAKKVVIYGPEGIGKSTFLSMFPGVIFMDTEGSTYEMDVIRTPKPSSWAMLLEQVKYYISHPNELGTLALDTADWAEKLCISHLCSTHQKDGIEGFGYGKGYVYLEEEFGRFLNLLEEVIGRGVNVAIAAHAEIVKFDLPEEMGSYNRWQMKLEKKTAPLLKEWADMVLFANYEVHVINVDNQGAAKGKNKVQGGKRVMYTSHHPCWDAKNRNNLAAKLDFDYKAIAHCIITGVQTASPALVQNQDQAPVSTPPVPLTPPPTQLPVQQEPPKQAPAAEDLSKVPKPLADLMIVNNVTIAMVQKAVGNRGYYPQDTPIENYDPQFISGVLVGAWPQVYQLIQKLNQPEIPF